MKKITKLLSLLTLVAFLCAFIFSACTNDISVSPTTAANTTSEAPTSATTTIAVTDAPQTPATTTAGLNIPITPVVTTTTPSSDPPPPVTSEPPSVIDRMANMGCPDELLPILDREASDSEIASIQSFFTDPYVAALLCSESFTKPSDIDLRGFIYAGVYLPDESHPNASPGADEIQAVALASGSYTLLNTDCFRWTSAELNSVLMKYLGISFTDEIGLNMLQNRMETQREVPTVSYYSPTDAYYLFCTDSGRATSTVQSAWRCTDGKYLVQYTGVCNSMVVLLNPCENSYTIEMEMELAE